ncbi:MAG TPA: S8 family serine peptidase [Solirubrobacteraceae bacterium]|nr:S8 family serine peptidase [Solirubrobacteraceae bacterium]
MPHLTTDDGTTGRYLVLFAEDARDAGAAALSDAAGISMAVAEDATAVPEAGGGLLFGEIDVAVVDAPPDQADAAVAAAADSGAILAVEPERWVRALEVVTPYTPEGAATGNGVHAPAAEPPPPLAPPSRSSDYLAGFRDAVLYLTRPDGPMTADAGLAAAVTAAAVDESQATWGIQGVKAVFSCRSGRGIKVAVLDTGMDLKHPDFAGRNVTSQSFIPGQAVQDGHGHGTHCIGTATGPKCPAIRPRYGVAHEADIFAGKVLNDTGRGTDGQILAGINWAIANKCEVISMSLGAPVQAGQSYSTVYETVAQRALQAGSLIVAAAGNDSNRPSLIRPVGHPANCPSILAVAALDSSLAIAWFSNRGINPQGGQIDIAGPGVNVYSSVPMPARYGRKSGTSMATPHAAGIAALLAEANPGARGAALGQLLAATAQRLTTLPGADVGAGLIQAP